MFLCIHIPGALGGEIFVDGKYYCLRPRPLAFAASVPISQFDQDLRRISNLDEELVISIKARKEIALLST